jgi:predicted heme/steroid binding protein
MADNKHTPTFSCAAPYPENPCKRKVGVNGAVCGFCMYDGHNGVAYPKDSVGWQEAYKALYRCYKNDGKKFAGIRAGKRLSEQLKPEAEQSKKA